MKKMTHQQIVRRAARKLRRPEDEIEAALAMAAKSVGTDDHPRMTKEKRTRVQQLRDALSKVRVYRKALPEIELPFDVAGAIRHCDRLLAEPVAKSRRRANDKRIAAQAAFYLLGEQAAVTRQGPLYDLAELLYGVRGTDLYYHLLAVKKAK